MSNAVEQKILSEVKAFVGDLGKRAFNTFWQTCVAVAGVVWVTSGLSVNDLTTADGLHKFFAVVVAGIFAAGLSAVKTLLVGYVTEHGPGLVLQVAKDADIGAVPVTVVGAVAQVEDAPASSVTVTEPASQITPASGDGSADAPGVSL